MGRHNNITTLGSTLRRNPTANGMVETQTIRGSRHALSLTVVTTVNHHQPLSAIIKYQSPIKSSYHHKPSLNHFKKNHYRTIIKPAFTIVNHHYETMVDHHRWPWSILTEAHLSTMALLPLAGVRGFLDPRNMACPGLQGSGCTTSGNIDHQWSLGAMSTSKLLQPLGAKHCLKVTSFG